jgi:hypothetical protein
VSAANTQAPSGAFTAARLAFSAANRLASDIADSPAVGVSSIWTGRTTAGQPVSSISLRLRGESDAKYKVGAFCIITQSRFSIALGGFNRSKNKASAHTTAARPEF